MKNKRIINHKSLTSERVLEAYNQAYETSDYLRDSDSAYRWVLRKLDIKQDKQLLDIAFGLGVLIKEAQLKGLHCTGIDISSSVAKLVHSFDPTISLTIANGEQLPFIDHYFDYVTNLGSLEHFLDPESGLHEIKRVLKPDGKAAILLPNGYYFPDLVLKVWRRGYGPSHKQIVERFAAKNEWKDFIEENGLKVIKIYKYNFFLPETRQDWKWFIRHPKRLIPPLLGLFFPFNFSFSFLYICHPDNE